MESRESPLEVLSRAATMVQENQSVSDDPTKPYTKHTTKWKRERRPKPPEYPRKPSDSKYTESLLGESSPSPPTSASPESSNGAPPWSPSTPSTTSTDTPLDMSVRQRGLPPSYAQTMSNPGYRSNYRPSVIHNGVPPRDELPSGMSMCDPIIDEHFRRSLGNDYHVVFQNNNSSKDSTTSSNTSASTTPPKTPPAVTTTSSVIELMDGTGLSVDDHFAKALGDTWTKLNRKEGEIKNGSSENGLVST